MHRIPMILAPRVVQPMVELIQKMVTLSRRLAKPIREDGKANPEDGKAVQRGQLIQKRWQGVKRC
jgi:hypothetical protein